MKYNLQLSKVHLYTLIAFGFIFTLDLLIPLGVSVGTLYILCFFFMIKQTKKNILFFTLLAIVLLFVKLALYHSPFIDWQKYVNRGISALVILFISWIEIRHRKFYEQTNNVIKAHSRTVEEANSKLEAMQQGIDTHLLFSITDVAGTIIYVNDNFCELSKYTKEELVGKNHRMINSGFHPKEFFKDLYKTIKTEGVWRNEVKNKAKDGTYFWTDMVVFPILGKNGNIIQYLYLRVSIDERKKIEQERQEHRKELEREKEKAESATEIAEGALESKQQFLANMSHEIRTPMNAIVGFTKVLLKTDLSVNQTEYLNAIKTSGDALIVLINDILDLAKVDAGKTIFEKTPFKLKPSLSGVLQMLEVKMQEKKLTFINDYDSNIPEVLIGDFVRLQQIILNLLSNALKFTPKGGITVKTELLSENDKEVLVQFSVIDTGIGIAEDKLKFIFENFQQATSSTSRVFGGTGLGLAIVKQLVEKQGGTINIESKINEGSTFSFTMSFPKTNAKIKLDEETLELDANIQNIKVLVVEDVKLNQLLMRTILDEFNFKSDMADNGKIALEKMQTENYDIVLMDLQMPEMDGFEATSQIRNKMNSKIPIIALTADVTSVDIDKCKAVGMNGYITKPLDERVLYAKIIELLDR